MYCLKCLKQAEHLAIFHIFSFWCPVGIQSFLLLPYMAKGCGHLSCITAIKTVARKLEAIHKCLESLCVMCAKSIKTWIDKFGLEEFQESVHNLLV